MPPSLIATGVFHASNLAPAFKQRSAYSGSYEDGANSIVNARKARRVIVDHEPWQTFRLLALHILAPSATPLIAVEDDFGSVCLRLAGVAAK